MSLPSIAVKRWQVTLVAFLMLVALGTTSFFAIPKAEDPTFPFPNFAVIAVLPGATPRDVERLVADPLEARIKSLDDIKTLKTEVSDGLAVVQVEFSAGTDPARKRDEVLRETTSLRPNLPADLARLDVREFNAAKVNVIEVGLASQDAPYRELDALARRLKRQLESVAGVGEVEVAGAATPEVTLTLDLERMVALGISPNELAAAVSGDATNVPGGAVEAGSRRLGVKTTGDYASIDEVAQTVVRTVPSGATVRVRDVARVNLGDAEPVHLVRWDGRRAVLVAATMKERQNVFAVNDKIVAELDAFEKELPPNVALTRGFDQSKNVGHRLGGFTRDFGLAIFLVLLTLLPLGFRASAVVMISIPLSLSIGLALLNFAGYSINQLSIVGFVIALGLLVDDSVVVVENITRFLRLGHSPLDAAIRGTEQITLSVLGCTATLVLAFLPLLALPGAPGLFIRSMPVAVVFTILASLLVSLTIVPFLARLFLKSDGEHGNAAFRAMTWLIEASYRRVLTVAIGRPKTTVLVAMALFLGSLAWIPKIGFSLFPKAGIPQFSVRIELPDGTSLAETDRATRWAEAVVREDPHVRKVVANVGKGNPRVYYNVGPANEQTNVAEIFAELDTYEAREQAGRLASLRTRLAAGYPAATIEVREFENGPPLDAPIAIRILGENPIDIERAAERIEGVMRSTPGTRYVKNPASDRKSDVRIAVDRPKAAALGIAIADLERAVRLAIAGVVVGKYKDGDRDETVDIRLVLPRRDAAVPLPGGARPTLGVLETLYVPAQAGAVPLAQVATLGFERSQSRIFHYDRTRSATVTAFVEDGYNTDRVTKEILRQLAGEPMQGVRIVPAGEIESRSESFGGLGTAIVVALFGVLGVLVLEFRTFKSTLIVASVIPLGVVGGLAALFLSGYSLSFTATIGFVALMGIEVKNSILLVDFTNRLRAEGMATDLAIQRAGEVRFVPILLTTLTALGGLLPLVLERSALYSPLAVVLVGGLVSSTVLARIVTPVLYKLLAPSVAPAEARDDAAVASAALA